MKRADRRRNSSDFRGRPRPNPVNVLILTVAGVLVVTAAAGALLGGGHEETTPHGQILASLQRMAKAQETHHRRAGTFSVAPGDPVEAAEGVRVNVIRADRESWQAVASHDVGLTCVQGGQLRAGRVQREQPVCFAD